MTSLKVLDLSFNSFTGPLPDDLFLLTNLVELRLNDNLLTGSISSQISKLSNLQLLEIGYQAYDSDVYEDYGAVPNYGSNKLTGVIPKEMCSLTNLIHLQLNNNDLTGPLPSCVSQMTALRRFDVRFNRLSGTLPKFSKPSTQTDLCPVVGWQKLFLLLNDNQFEGKLDSLEYYASGDFRGLPNLWGCPRGALFNRGGDLTHHAYDQPRYKTGQYYDWIQLRGNRFDGTIPSWIINIGGDAPSRLDLR
jgi:hypothetical protein